MFSDVFQVHLSEGSIKNFLVNISDKAGLAHKTIKEDSRGFQTIKLEWSNETSLINYKHLNCYYSLYNKLFLQVTCKKICFSL